MIMMPSRPRMPTLFIMGEQLKGVFNKLERQEDDSGVNHLWKGEMWPARVDLIHARHVQNTRGAGANNWSSCQWAAVISFDILIVSQSNSNFGSLAVSPRTCPCSAPICLGACRALVLTWLRAHLLWMCVSGPSSISEGNRAWLLPFPLALVVWVRAQAYADNCHVSELLEFVELPCWTVSPPNPLSVQYTQNIVISIRAEYVSVQI